MPSFVQSHRKLSSIIAIIVLMAAMLFNVYLLTSPYSEANSNTTFLTEDEINRRLPGFNPADGQDKGSAALIPTMNSTLVGASLGVVVVGIIAIVLVMKLVDRKKVKQGSQLKDQLVAVAGVFENYGRKNGHYPISSTYKPEHYSGVHMGKEWLAYGLPKEDEMRQYEPNWPLIDQDQLAEVVYYPKQAGQAFALYATIDGLAEGEALDYNIEDNIPKAWGEFNYRVVSQGIGAVPATVEAVQPVIPVETPAEANNPAEPAD